MAQAAAGFLKAAPRGLTVVVLIAFAVLIGLGIWQWQRLDWKQDLLADLQRTQKLPSAPLVDVLAQPNPAWRAVILPPCPVTPERAIAMHSASEGRLGHRILIACPAGDKAILVDLGFVTQGIDIRSSLPPGFTPVGRLRSVDVKGTAPDNNPGGNDWYWRSPSQMGAALNTPLREDYFVVLDLAASGIKIDGFQQGALTAPLTNRHLEYALTWFALAWTLMAIYAVFVVQRMRKA